MILIWPIFKIKIANFLVILNQNNLHEGDWNQNRDFDKHDFDFKNKIMTNSGFSEYLILLIFFSFYCDELFIDFLSFLHLALPWHWINRGNMPVWAAFFPRTPEKFIWQWLPKEAFERLLRGFADAALQDKHPMMRKFESSFVAYNHSSEGSRRLYASKAVIEGSLLGILSKV